MKTTFFAVFLVLALIADVVQLRGDTIAYWRFEEGAANQTATGAGTILDSSGNNLNGTPINGPVYSANVAASPVPQTGASNNLSLDFSSAASQRVFIPDDPRFQLTHSLTLEAYIDPRVSSSSFSQIIFRGDDRLALDPYYLATFDQSGTPVLIFNINDAVGGSATVTAPLPAYNTWYHVAGTLNDATGAMDLYINGQLVNSVVTGVRPFGPLDPTELPGLGIGDVQSPNFGESFNGLIDEVRMSDQALTPSQFLDAVPEPSSAISLTCLGAAALLVCLRRRWAWC